MSVDVAESNEPNAERAIERDLILRLAGGDDEAVGPLYDRLSRPLFSLILHLLRDRAEAEDVLHDTFLAIRDKAAAYDASKGSALAWAVTMARNRALDRLRKRHRRGELLAQAAPQDLGYETNDEPAADSPWADLRPIIQEVLAKLPDEQRAALELVYFSGLSHVEIADRLALPLGTVKARVRRGLMRLRALLPPQLSF